MPGAVPYTSTLALTSAIFPFLYELCEHGLGALRANRALARGVNCYRGRVTQPGLTAAQDLPLAQEPWGSD